MLPFKYPKTKEIVFSQHLEEKWPVTTSIVNEYSGFREALRSAIEGELFEEIRDAFSKYIIYVQCLEMFDQKNASSDSLRMTSALPYPPAVLPTLRPLVYSWSGVFQVPSNTPTTTAAAAANAAAAMISKFSMNASSSSANATPVTYVDYHHGRCDLIFCLYAYCTALVNNAMMLVDGPLMHQDCAIKDYRTAFKRLQNAAGIYQFISLLTRSDGGFPSANTRTVAELRPEVATALSLWCQANANRITVRKFIASTLSQQQHCTFRTIARICVDAALLLASALDSLKKLGTDYVTLLPLAFRQQIEHGILLEEAMTYKYMGMHHSDLNRNEFGIATACFQASLKLIKLIDKNSILSEMVQSQTTLIEDKLRACQYSLESMVPPQRVSSEAEVKGLLPERSQIVEPIPFKIPPGIFQAVQPESSAPSQLPPISSSSSSSHLMTHAAASFPHALSPSAIENPFLRSSQLSLTEQNPLSQPSPTTLPSLAVAGTDGVTGSSAYFHSQQQQQVRSIGTATGEMNTPAAFHAQPAAAPLYPMAYQGHSYPASPPMYYAPNPSNGMMPPQAAVVVNAPVYGSGHDQAPQGGPYGGMPVEGASYYGALPGNGNPLAVSSQQPPYYGVPSGQPMGYHTGGWPSQGVPMNGGGVLPPQGYPSQPMMAPPGMPFQGGGVPQNAMGMMVQPPPTVNLPPAGGLHPGQAGFAQRPPRRREDDDYPYGG